MAYLPSIQGKLTPTTLKFFGVNTEVSEFDVSNNELIYARNIHGGEAPSLSVRQGRAKAFTQITTPNCLSQRNNEYPYVLDGTTLKRWDGSAWQTVQTGLANAQAKIIEFSYTTTLYNIIADGTNVYSYDGSSAVSIATAPKTPFYTAHSGRVYALKGKLLSYCALNLITDWTTANDAGKISLSEVKGDGTGITSYNGSVMCFTEFSTHELWGTGPINYSLKTISQQIGCISDRSIIEHKRSDGASLLYWLGRDGKGICLYVYGGGKPRKVIPDKMKEYFQNVNMSLMSKCCAGVYGDSIFISIPYGASATNNNLVLEYNTKLEQWYPHTGSIVQFTTIGDKLYGIDTTGQIWDMANGTLDDTSAISWSAKTKFFRVNTQKLTVERLDFVFNLPLGSTMTLGYTNTVNGVYTTLYTFTAAVGDQQITIPLKSLQNINWFGLEFSGTGPAIIHDCTLFMTAIPYAR